MLELGKSTKIWPRFSGLRESESKAQGGLLCELLEHPVSMIDPDRYSLEEIDELTEMVFFYTTYENWAEGACDGCEEEKETGCGCNLNNPIHRTFMQYVLTRNIQNLPNQESEEDDFI